MCWEGHEGGDYVQDWAEEHGFIKAVRVTEPCDPDVCICAEVGFPAMCYRFTEYLAGEK
jgi:hypothetical protein